ncbi:MAG: S41 family peptidase [Verrucomicrobia bacterium]|nr:S41 family peptidase [Verrucomicrobiota bacterium]
MKAKASAGLILFLFLFALSTLRNAAAVSPDIDKIYNILNTNIVGISESDLNRQLIEGMIGSLEPLARIDKDGESAKPGIASTNLFEQRFAYIRLSTLNDGVSESIKATLKQLSDTNDIKGLILDLRFAGGNSYKAVSATADLFIDAQKMVFKHDNTQFEVAPGDIVPKTPILILTNKKTAFGAELLAGVMKLSQRALILGDHTTGAGYYFKDFAVSDGRRLLVASGKIEFENGEEFPVDGILPDIRVDVPIEHDKLYIEDPYRVIEGSSTASNYLISSSQQRTNRINEAALIRMNNGEPATTGEDGESETNETPDQPVIRDPVLSRAIDLLKGLHAIKLINK